MLFGPYDIAIVIIQMILKLVDFCLCFLCYLHCYRPDASFAPASSTIQLQADLPVAGRWLSGGKSNQRTVAIMGFNDMVVDEDHLF